MRQVAIINGPNLNLLGTREKGIYGEESLESINARIAKLADKLMLNCKFYQSNNEGQLIDLIHQAAFNSYALIINPGGYSHTSIAIMDALRSIDIIKVEVHLSNIFSREDYRRKSYSASACEGSISGLGSDGYFLALQYISNKISEIAK